MTAETIEIATDPLWELRYEIPEHPELVPTLAAALTVVARDALLSAQLRSRQLTWTVQLRSSPNVPMSEPELFTLISTEQRDLYGFGLSFGLDLPTAIYRFADELQFLAVEDHIQWPTIEGRIPIAKLSNGVAVWKRKGEVLAKVGELAKISPLLDK